MKIYNLDKQDRELIEEGLVTAKRGFVDDRKNRIGCDLAGALITKSGKIFTGINLDVKSSAGASICGERSAIMHMISQAERTIETIVAVWISRDYNKNKKGGILQPCGICRHDISQFGDPWVIISKSKKVKLNELYPLPVK